jgi:putative copper export protein
MAGSLAIADLRIALLGTRMGVSTLAQIWVLLAVGILAIAGWSRISSVVALVLPFLFSAGSHAAARESGAVWAMALDCAHALAASLWGGGLLALVCVLGRARAGDALAADAPTQIILRFSRLALGCAFAVAAAGVWLALLYGVAPTHPWTTTYGKLVCAKAALLLLTLVAASVNHFVHLPRLREGGTLSSARDLVTQPITEGASAQELAIAQAVRREATIELALVLIIFILAGFLTQTSPG